MSPLLCMVCSRMYMHCCAFTHNATACRMGFAYADMTGPDEHLPVQDDDRRALEHRPLAELERVQPAAVVHLWEGGWKQMRSRGSATCVCVRTRVHVCSRVCVRVFVRNCQCMTCARVCEYTVCADLLAEARAAEARAARHEPHRVRVAEPAESVAASLTDSVTRDTPGARTTTHNE